MHTALHGVGDATLRAVLASAGWPAPVPVAAQQQPDPAFPTVPYPNPEEPGVLDLAAATAEREGADLVLANDPDADRLAVMVPGPEGWRMLTGDELGALLGHAVLTGLASGDLGAPGRASPGRRHHGRLRLAAPPARAGGRRALRHHADRLQVDRAGGRRRRRAGLRLRAGARLRGPAGPGGRQGRDKRGAARAAAGGGRGRPRAGAGRPAGRPRAGPRGACHPAAVAAGGRRGRPCPAGRRGRTGPQGAAARRWPGSRSR